MAPISIVTSDWHLTDQETDAYRWGIFPYLESLSGIDSLYILGDLTDRKDRHPSEFVNRMVESFQSLIRHIPSITLLCGNHDYLVEGEPFFRFLGQVGVQFIRKPTRLFIYERWPALFFPHTKQGDPFSRNIDWSNARVAFIHATLNGSQLGNHQAENALVVPKELRSLPILSGDVHIPQIVGNVVYAGSPYHVRFGDSFEPRVLKMVIEKDDIDLVSIPTPFPSKKTIHITPDTLDGDWSINDGDMVKVVCHITESQVADRFEFMKTIQKKTSRFSTIVDFIVTRRKVEDSHRIRHALTLEDMIREYGKEKKYPDDVIYAGIKLAADR